MRNAAARSRGNGVSDHLNEGPFDMTDDTIDAEKLAAKRAHLRAYHAEWRAKNPERWKEITAKTRAKNREKVLANSAKWAKANPDRVKAKMDKWREANRDVARTATKKWRAKHPDRSRAAVDRWSANNAERVKATKANRRTRELKAEGVFTAADIKVLFVRQRGRCAYCSISLKSGYNIDHITALARGGTNWPKNLQLTCALCNNRKHAKDPIAFAQELGRLI